MANKFWGGVVNALLPGTPYNKYTGQYGQTALRNSIISGIAGQLNPIAGTLTQAAFNQTAPQQQWNAGLQVGEHFSGVRDSVRNSLQPTMDVPDIAIGGFGGSQLQTGGSPLSQMVAGPSMDAYNDRMAQAMQGITGRINAAYAAQPAYNATQGVRDRGQGHTGEAAQSIFQSMSDASRFNSTPQSFGDYTQRWT